MTRMTPGQRYERARANEIEGKARTLVMEFRAWDATPDKVFSSELCNALHELSSCFPDLILPEAK